MKKNILLCALLIYGIISNAQNFSQEFENNVTLEAKAYSIVTGNNGYTAGFTIIDSANNDFRKTVKLMSTDFDGNIQSSKVYQAIDSNYSITCSQVIVLGDGSKIVSGVYSLNNSFPHHPYIMLINTDDTIAWANKITANGSKTILKKLADNSILLIFDFQSLTAHKVFCKLDVNNGNLSSFKEANGLYGQITAIKTYANSFDIMFLTKGLLNINNDLSAINWQRNYYNEIGNTFNRTANGDYIYASAQTAFPGYMTVFRTSASGTLIWAKYIESWNGQVQNQGSYFDIVGFHFIKEDANGNIIVCADSEGSSNGAFNVVLNANGNYLDNYKIETFHNEMVVLNSNQYLIGGFLNSADYNTANFILEKRDLTTTYSCDLTYSYSIANGVDMALTPETITLTDSTFMLENINVALLNNETISQNDYCNMTIATSKYLQLQNLAQIYPNPSNSIVWIKSDKKITQVKLYNYLGQHIETSNLSFIDLNQYAEGIYFLEIEINHRYIEIKKIIKK